MQNEVMSASGGNSKGSTVTVVLVAVLVALVFGAGGYWLGLKKSDTSGSLISKITPIKTEENGVLIINKAKQASWLNADDRTIEWSTPEGYTTLYGKYPLNPPYIYLIKEKAFYLYNVATSEITKGNLPELVDTDTTTQSFGNSGTISRDGAQALVSIDTYNKKDLDQPGMGGPPAISGTTYLFNAKKNNSQESDIFAIGKELIKGEKAVSIAFWDSDGNRLFGHRSGQGIGNTTPLYVVNLQDETVAKTEKYADSGVRPFISPSFKKFILYNSHDSSLMLFNSNDLSKPEKTIGIKGIFDQDCANIDEIQQSRNLPTGSCTDKGVVYSVAWNDQEDQVAIGLNTLIFTLNLNTDETVLRFTDQTLGASYMFWMRNDIQFLPSGKSIVFVDNDNSIQSGKDMIKDENNKFYLTAVNLGNNEKSVLYESKDIFSLMP